MKKVLFTTLSIIAVAAMVMVSCKKEPAEKPDDNKEEQKVDEDLVGTWTITGEAYGWDQTNGLAMTESDNVWTAAEVSIKGEGIKFVKDASWDVNLGAKEDGAKEDDVEFELEKGGKNIKGAKDGVYSVTLNLLTKKAKIKFVKDLEPAGPAGNLWAAAEEANALLFFQYYANYAWAPYEGYDNVEAATFENVVFADGVYTVTYPGSSPSRWQCQFFMHPDPSKAPVALKAGKNYEVSFTLEANSFVNAFAKFCAYGPDGPKHEGAPFKEWGNANDCKGFALNPGKPVTITEVVAGSDVDNVHFTFDFGTHGANTVIKISDISIEETDAEVGGEGAPEPLAIVANGDIGDWGVAGVSEYAGDNNRFKHWRVYNDQYNFYFLFHVNAEKIKTSGDPASYNWGSYVYIGFDLDNNATTGYDGEAGGAGNNGGLEALGLVYPWRGETLTFHVGKDEQGKFEIPVGTELAGAKLFTGGYIDGDIAFVEVAVPRSYFGDANPAKDATVVINAAMNYYPTGREEYVVK